MTNTKTLWHRQLIVLLSALLLFGSIFSVTAYAADVTISTANSASYFQTFSSKGVWTSILTPQHTINETGQVAYCLQPAMDSPNNSGYEETSGWNYYDRTTMLGLQAILENGYPNFNGGFTDEQARYATANAIRFWVAERGCGGSLAWMDLTKYGQYFRGASGYEALFNWCVALVGCARTQSVIEHSAWLSSPTITDCGDYFQVTTTVHLENCDWGYTIDQSALPSGTSISGYTANSGDILTIKIPSIYSASDFELKTTAYDNRTTASLVFYAPDYSNQQRILTYTWSNGAAAANAAIAVTLPEPTVKDGTVRICKTDSETGLPIANVLFKLYNSKGELINSGRTDSGGILELTAELGEYVYVEAETADGYILDKTEYPVTVTAGQVTEIKATNAPILITGSIAVNKLDIYGEPLSGAVFKLEMSTDGNSFSGLATAETDSTGIAVFNDLTIEGCTYRLTEAKAPAGYSLQAGVIYEGSISKDTTHMVFTVWDNALTILPFTGSTNYTTFILLMLCMGFFVTLKMFWRNAHEENI